MPRHFMDTDGLKRVASDWDVIGHEVHDRALVVFRRGPSVDAPDSLRRYLDDISTYVYRLTAPVAHELHRNGRQLRWRAQLGEWIDSRRFSGGRVAIRRDASGGLWGWLRHVPPAFGAALLGLAKVPDREGERLLRRILGERANQWLGVFGAAGLLRLAADAQRGWNAAFPRWVNQWGSGRAPITFTASRRALDDLFRDSKTIAGKARLSGTALTGAAGVVFGGLGLHAALRSYADHVAAGKPRDAAVDALEELGSGLNVAEGGAKVVAILGHSAGAAHVATKLNPVGTLVTLVALDADIALHYDDNAALIDKALARVSDQNFAEVQAYQKRFGNGYSLQPAAGHRGEYDLMGARHYTRMANEVFLEAFEADRSAGTRVAMVGTAMGYQAWAGVKLGVGAVESGVESAGRALTDVTWNVGSQVADAWKRAPWN